MPHKAEFAELGFMHVWVNSNFIFRDFEGIASKEHNRVFKVPITKNHEYDVLSYSIGIGLGYDFRVL